VKFVEQVAKNMDRVSEVIPTMLFNASEDATFMMEEVQRQGGKATYLLFGTELKAGHHHHSFDFDEGSLLLGVEVFANLLYHLQKNDSKSLCG
jgi:aminobenzoyl-glutamate utilization protein A